MKRIHFIQHVAFEAPGLILSWAKANNFQCSTSILENGDPVPNANDFDMLVIMGGPMSANDDNEYSWLKKEKELVSRCLETKKPMVGVCLGAQIIANVLGSKVYRGKEKEIGWFPISANENIKNSKLMPEIPKSLTVFHWHGETFDLPNGAKLLASTEVCPNQAFEFNDHVLALQFHMEVTRADVESMYEHCNLDIGKGDFQQSPPELFGRPEFYLGTKFEIEKALNNIWGLTCLDS